MKKTHTEIDPGGALAAKVVEAHRQFLERVKATGFPPPQTLEDLEHLAQLVEVPEHVIDSLTACDIAQRTEKWVDLEKEREQVRSKLRTGKSVRIPARVPTFNPKTGILLLGKREMRLTPAQSNVLTALIENTPTDLNTLDARSGHKDPHKILKRLVDRYPALKKCIRFAQKRGQGGYSTTIQTAGSHVTTIRPQSVL